MNAWFNRGSAIELKKQAVRCNKCASCADACPMGLSKMYSANKNMIYNQSGCIMCFKCIESCPKDDCLSCDFLGIKFLRSKF
jgi:ferredoxin